MYKDTNENGITLVTLVVTIILLLILAGVTISYISGGGIIDRTQVAMDMYENADKREQDIIDDIDDYNKQEIDLEPIYNEEGAEDNIAPAELFEYEIINDGSIASAYMQNLPTKTVRIIGMNPEYCNALSYDPFNDKDLSATVKDTNYEIIYNGNRIEDILVIPYQVELDENGKITKNGEMYTITEVDLSIISRDKMSYTILNDDNKYEKVIEHSGLAMPSVKKIIYPNTVEKIISIKEYTTGSFSNQWDTPEEIVLSKNLESVPHGKFGNDLKSIKIPTGIKGIEDFALAGYTLIKKIVIPKSIEYIGEDAFAGWGSDQTIYFECAEEDSEDWNPNWKAECNANIVWNYNLDEDIE